MAFFRLGELRHNKPLVALAFSACVTGLSASRLGRMNQTLSNMQRAVMLDDHAVAGLVSMTEAIDALEAAFADLAHGRAQVLGRQRIDCGAVKLSTMGGLWPVAGFAAIKSYLTVNGQFSFSTTGWDTDANQVVFTMTGDELTRLRTPALACLVTRQTVGQGGQLAVLGAGQQGRAHVEALHAQHHFNRIAVVDTADVSAWCAEATQRLQCPVQQRGSDEAIAEADLVLTSSRSKTPVFDGAGLKAGATVVAVGVSLPTGRELDDTTLRRASRVVVEWQPQSLHEAGEVVLGLASGALDADRIVDLPALYRQGCPWRQSASEIIVFKSVGVGLSDAAVARLIWQRWLAQQSANA